MTLTTEWPGDTLPAGWSFTSALGGGGHEVQDGSLGITTAAGTSYDSITGSSAVQNAPVVRHAVPAHPGGAISWAVQLLDDIGDTRSIGYCLLALGAAGGGFRWGIARPNTNDERPNFFCASRPVTGVGTNHISAHVNTAPAALQSGTPSFLRIDFDGVQTWDPYYSTDGFTWVDMGTFTRAFIPTELMIGMTSTTPNTGGTVRVGGSWDLLELGSTDVRTAPPARTRVPVSDWLGTDAAWPAGWVDDSANGDTITHVGGTVWRFHTDCGNLESRARIRWTGARLPEAGLLVAYQAETFDGDTFATWAIGGDLGGNPGIDVYVRGPGFGQERGATAVRPIRVDDPTGSNVASVPGSTGLDEKPYCWERNTTGASLSSGDPLVLNRLEVLGSGTHRRYRAKEWIYAGTLAALQAELAAMDPAGDAPQEPAAWGVFDGQDAIYAGDLGPGMVLSHNNPVVPLVGTSNLDFLYAGFYALEGSSPAQSARPIPKARWRRRRRRARR